jgi:hypothetical protein
MERAMAKVSKLTDGQKEQAKAYARKKWPDETVTVDDQLNGDGEVVFRRLKISTREVADLPKAKKAKDTR